MNSDRILAPLAGPAGIVYQPESKGLLSARLAVAQHYSRLGAALSPEQVVMTASTSEAYSHLFRLLCDPGDEVLIARPSYPLLDYLADLSDVLLRPFPLFRDHGWWMDLDQLERSIGPRSKAIVVIHPNNPTGHLTGAEERSRLHQLCTRHRLALIVDEVFLAYTHTAAAVTESFAVPPHPHLTFVVDGLSKLLALPQMKLGWIVTLGPHAAQAEALARLEIIADTFLSVATPAQLALPLWLEQSRPIQTQILDRIHRNLAHLRGAGLELDPVDAGWSAILRLPQVFAEESAFSTLHAAGVLTHPAHFYGLDDQRRVVISLIVPEQTTVAAVAVIRNLLAQAQYLG